MMDQPATVPTKKAAMTTIGMAVRRWKSLALALCLMAATSSATMATSAMTMIQTQTSSRWRLMEGWNHQ